MDFPPQIQITSSLASVWSQRSKVDPLGIRTISAHHAGAGPSSETEIILAMALQRNLKEAVLVTLPLKCTKLETIYLSRRTLSSPFCT